MNLHVFKTMDNRGSVILETAVVMPVMLLVLLLFVRLFQLVCAQNCLERAVLQTAADLRKYAIIYHEYGVANLEERLLAELGDNHQLTDFIDLRGHTEAVTDSVYEAAAVKMIQKQLEQDPLVQSGFLQIDAVDCADSDFFHRNDDILLRVKCHVFGRVSLGTALRFRGWVRGDAPLASLQESGISVWDYHNFTRGKILRDIFGGNLPYDYPVIASFQNGEALMIKSIDVTKQTYQTPANLAKEVTGMLDDLVAFQGTAGMSHVDASLQIQASEIKSKKLLLIFPTNPMTVEQSTALTEVIVSYQSLKNIQVEFQTYHASGEKQ